MQFTQGLVALFFLVAPALCAPTEGNLVSAADALAARDTTVTCRPMTNHSPTRNFRVSVDNAKSQARAVKFKTGRSDYPHRFGNMEHIHWGVRQCDEAKADLEEYPVFWSGSRQREWRADDKKSDQEKTPIRVMYANARGTVVYCGIVTHDTVGSDYAGSGNFSKCT
ncbi:Ribonuclease/ribotoxin [Xylaria telfairii]|nr:Ribonuclease/ribotoxin [Xylaria telfairii]